MMPRDGAYEMGLPIQCAARSLGETMPAVRKRSGRGGARPGAGRKPELEDPVSVTFDLERRDHEGLRALAEQRGKPLAALVRAAVRAFLRRAGR